MKIELVITDRADAIARLRAPQAFTHLLSFADSDRTYPVEGFEKVPERIAFFFDDISRWRKGYTMPAHEDIQNLLRFARSMRGRARLSILAHCEMGQSRSTAAAYIILAYLYGSGKEARAMADVVHARRIADPNDLMVEIADTILRREGKLKRELELARVARRAYGSGY